MCDVKVNLWKGDMPKKRRALYHKAAVKETLKARFGGRMRIFIPSTTKPSTLTEKAVIPREITAFFN
jgi:hypothetical protein